MCFQLLGISTSLHSPRQLVICWLMSSPSLALLLEAKTMSYSSLYPYHPAQFLAHRRGSINKVSEGMKTAMWFPSSCSLHTPHLISNMSHVWNSGSRPEAILLLGTFHSVWRDLGCHNQGQKECASGISWVEAILQWPGQPPQQRIIQPEKVISAEVEKPCYKLIGIWMDI